MNEQPLVCCHGGLRRQCETCEQADRADDAERKLAEALTQVAIEHDAARDARMDATQSAIDLEHAHARLAEAQATIERQQRQIKALRACETACREFVRKCESGEARRRRSYAQMVEALAALAAVEADAPQDGQS